MNNYNHQRPQDVLEKMATVAYVKFNALLETTDDTKNKNFRPSRSFN